MANIATSFSREIWETLKHPLAGDATLLVASQYIAAAIGLLTSIATARLLGPNDYGVAALTMSYPMLLWAVVGTKSFSVTPRYIAAFRTAGRNDELKSICKLGYGLDFLVSVLAFILVGTTSWWVARYVYNVPNVSWLMGAYAASFPFFSLKGTSWAILSSWQRFRWLAVFWVLDRGVTLLLVLGFLLAGAGIRGVVLGTAAGHVVIGLTMVSAATYVLYRDGMGVWWKSSLSSVASLRKELTAFFAWNYLMVTLSGLMAQVPLLLLGRLRGPEEAGFYRLATTLVTAGSYLENSLGNVAYPVLSARWSAGERESLSDTLKRWTLKRGALASALVLLTIPVLAIVVPLVLGAGYSSMVPGAQVMMAGVMVSTIVFWLDSYYYASGKIGLWTKTYGIYTALTIALSWFFIQQWGFFGMAALVASGKVLFTLPLARFALNHAKLSQTALPAIEPPR